MKHRSLRRKPALERIEDKHLLSTAGPFHPLEAALAASRADHASSSRLCSSASVRPNASGDSASARSRRSRYSRHSSGANLRIVGIGENIAVVSRILGIVRNLQLAGIDQILIRRLVSFRNVVGRRLRPEEIGVFFSRGSGFIGIRLACIGVLLVAIGRIGRGGCRCWPVYSPQPCHPSRFARLASSPAFVQAKVLFQQAVRF